MWNETKRVSSVGLPLALIWCSTKVQFVTIDTKLVSDFTVDTRNNSNWNCSFPQISENSGKIVGAYAPCSLHILSDISSLFFDRQSCNNKRVPCRLDSFPSSKTMFLSNSCHQYLTGCRKCKTIHEPNLRSEPQKAGRFTIPLECQAEMTICCCHRRTRGGYSRRMPRMPANPCSCRLPRMISSFPHGHPSGNTMASSSEATTVQQNYMESRLASG